MKQSYVIAIIISFNDPTSLEETIKALHYQVDSVLVIDNGSEVHSLVRIEALASLFKTNLIKLNQNFGIGYALNVGVNYAIQSGYKWVLTMDQDSIATEDMVEGLLKHAKCIPDLGSISPSFCLNLQNSKIIEKVEYSITSGNLVPISLYKKVGFYNEDYFIDAVDFDFSLKIRRAGLNNYRYLNGRLIHRLGNSINKKFFFLNYLYVEHSPIRRYYIFRNHFYLIKTYYKEFPFFCCIKSIYLLKMLIEIAVFDSNKKENFRFIKKGINDYLFGIYGKVNDEKK